MSQLKIALWLILSLSLSQGVSALEFFSGGCEYTQKELSNSDEVINLALVGEKFCNSIYLRQRLYEEINLPVLGKWSPIYPEKIIRQLLHQYGVPKDEPFEPWGGTYREWKVRGKKPFPPIDGYEALEYTVELLYVSLTGWMHIPKSNNYGVIPVCERSIVKLYAIKTERGWYVETPGPGSSLGDSVQRREKNLLKNHYIADPEKGRKFIQKTYRVLEDRCKDHLN